MGALDWCIVDPWFCLISRGGTMFRFSIVVLASVVLTVGTTVYLVAVYKKREQYTRERFAFAAMTAFLGFAATIVSSIADKESPWTTIANLLREIRHLPIQNEAARTPDHLLLVIVLAIVARFIHGLYIHWTGAISEDEQRRQIDDRRPALLRDGLEEVTRFGRYRRRKISAPTSSAGMQFEPLDIPSYMLEWHLRALDLTVLRNPQLRFDRDRGFHAEHHAWIGEHAQTHRPVALLCLTHAPQSAEIESLQRYMADLGNDREPLVIAAIQNGSEKRDEVLAGVSINIIGEEALLEDLVDFGDYFEHLRRRVESNTLADSDKTLAMVYAPSSGVLEGDTDVIPDVEHYLAQWATEPGQRHLALLGEYGQGKSTAALLFAHHLIQRANGKPSRVPILIELRGRSPRNSSPAGLIAEWAFPFTRVQAKGVMKLIEAGRTIVILEGFDEMALAGDAQARYAHFRVLWAFASPRSKVLFTGRPNYFLDDHELKAALNIADSTASGPYCESVRLEPFSPTQMSLALRAYPQATREGVLKLVHTNPRFREIASRGSLLYAIGELWGRPNGLGQARSDMNSAAVMGAFIRSTYQRQAEKLFRKAEHSNRELADFMVLNTPERALLTRAVACYMAFTRAPNQISSRSLQRFLEKLIPKIPDDVSTHVIASSREPSIPLRQRVKDMEHAVESIVTDVRACGLLVNDPSKPDHLKFSHKSFMEYLVAEWEARNYGRETDEFRYQIALYPAFPVEARSPSFTLVTIPEAMGFLAEILANSTEQRLAYSTEKKISTNLERARIVSIWISKEIFLGYKAQFRNFFLALFRGDPFTEAHLILQALTGKSIDEQAALRFLIKHGDRVNPWILYVACCASLGIEPIGLKGMGKVMLCGANLWLRSNLPHLIVHSTQREEGNVPSCTLTSTAPAATKVPSTQVSDIAGNT
jgi:hypothetical protein